MIFSGSLTLEADQGRVWDTVLDMNEVSQCIPGLQSVEQIDERTFDGVIEARVGPIAGRFSFRAHITESQPPNELVAHLEGTDSVTKSTVNGDTVVTLAVVDGTHTQLAYRSTVNVKGRLAILGDMVLRATGNLMLQETTQRLRARIEEAQRSA